MEEQNNTEQQQTPEPQSATESQSAPEMPQADPADVEKNKTMAILAYFLFFLPLITDAKDSPFAKFHANQSLALVISSFGIYFISGALAFITFGILNFIVSLAMIAIFVFWVMGIVNASNGEMKELPLIGGIHIFDK